LARVNGGIIHTRRVVTRKQRVCYWIVTVLSQLLHCKNNIVPIQSEILKVFFNGLHADRVLQTNINMVLHINFQNTLNIRYVKQFWEWLWH